MPDLPPFDAARVDRVLQYALAVSNSALGRLHLMKYVYLADLRYAETHDGKTYTGADWRFLHFGPWTAAVQDRFEPAVIGVGASERRFTTDKAPGEHVWYQLSKDERLADRLANELPWEVTTAVRWTMKDHGTDTPALLQLVYLTRPMLRAAPGEALDFGGLVPAVVTVAAPQPERPPAKSKSAQKLIEERRVEVQRRLARRDTEKLVPPNPPPRYDEQFHAGTEWLDGMSGGAIKAIEGRAEVADDVWKSPTRSDPDVS